MVLLALAQITVASLLAEMSDLDRLSFPAGYRTAQSSSYDRASKSPTEDWFANGDAGKFLRVEEHDGRREHVMADLIGPGAVVRIWSANPAGVVRFYFDGESQARLTAPLAELLRGKTAPFGDAYAYESSRGCNIYFPFPYRKSLKITVDESGDVRGLYYHVGYRSYGPDASVATFDPTSLDVPPAIATPAQRGEWATASGSGRVKSTTSLSLKGVGIVRLLEVDVSASMGRVSEAWNDPKAIHNILSSNLITIEADGERAVVAPLGDFFGSAPGLTPYRSQAMEVTADGKLRCRFPMPFSKNLRVQIANRGAATTPLTMRALVDRSTDVGPFRFHAQWEYDRGRTRPMRDLHFLVAEGEGRFVGSYLHVENPTAAWWGEGDEKMYVDGETFPSTFGTGTEDYYGYAWCCPDPFQRLFHGQPRCDGPGNFGHTGVFRWQTFDDIPYTKSMKFDLEMWHWADVTATWSRTTYWYAKPGGTGNHDVTLKLPVELAPPSPVKGAIEGETLVVASSTGGTHEAQEGFWELSNGKQLWWMDAKEGDRITLLVPVKQAGTYRIVANLCHAKDYGIHEIYLDGKRLTQLDFYGTGVNWKKLTLGTATLAEGTVKLEIVCRGSNPKADPKRMMFGLDYLLLEKR